MCRLGQALLLLLLLSPFLPFSFVSVITSPEGGRCTQTEFFCPSSDIAEADAKGVLILSARRESPVQSERTAHRFANQILDGLDRKILLVQLKMSF